MRQHKVAIAVKALQLFWGQHGGLARKKSQNGAAPV
jgi:hypothetical protein